jgi:hypothetical protein
MVRPDEVVMFATSRCIELAGASPARVSAGAPGSRLQSWREIAAAERSVKSPRKGGATKRAATSRQACSLDRASAERRTRGPSRSCHGEGNRQRMATGLAAAGPLRGRERSTLRQLDAEQERPSSAPIRLGTGSTHKVKTPKGNESREGVRGARSTGERGDNPREGRGPALVARATGVSAGAWL